MVNSWRREVGSIDGLQNWTLGLVFGPGMCRKLDLNCGYPQFRVIFAQKLGWCWVVGVNLPKLGSNYPNFTPISPPNCGKIGVVVGVGGGFSHIDWVGVVVGGVKTSFCTSLIWTTVLNFGVGSRTTVFIFGLGSPTTVLKFGLVVGLQHWIFG